MEMRSVARITLFFLLVVCTEWSTQATTDDRPDGIERMELGVKTASAALGVDVSRGVARLVSAGLSAWRAGGKGVAAPGVLAGFFRLLGLDGAKLGAIALNALVFIAQLVKNALIEPKFKPARKFSYEFETSPVDWTLKKPPVQKLMDIVQDRSLPDFLVDDLADKVGNTACLQLLVCKCSPFIWGMQRSVMMMVKGKTGFGTMFSDLPSPEEVWSHGDSCEERFTDCLQLEKT